MRVYLAGLKIILASIGSDAVYTVYNLHIIFVKSFDGKSSSQPNHSITLFSENAKWDMQFSKRIENNSNSVHYLRKSCTTKYCAKVANIIERNRNFRMYFFNIICIFISGTRLPKDPLAALTHACPPNIMRCKNHRTKESYLHLYEYHCVRYYILKSNIFKGKKSLYESQIDEELKREGAVVEIVMVTVKLLITSLFVFCFRST